MNRWRGVIEEYRKFLPMTEKTPVISLGEGNTPLICATRLAKAIAPGVELYLKFEGVNPTGSFKDRGMTIGHLKGSGSRRTGRHVRIDRQYLRFGRRLWGSRRVVGVRVDPRRKDRHGETVSGDDASGDGHSDRREL